MFAFATYVTLVLASFNIKISANWHTIEKAAYCHTDELHPVYEFITLLVAPLVAAPRQAMCELCVLTSFRPSYYIGVCTVVLMKTFGRSWKTQRYLVFLGFIVF